jgi:polar amino acid transport system permease protein
MPIAQRLAQRGVIHHASTADIDQPGTGLHHGDGRLIDQLVRLRRADDNIASACVGIGLHAAAYIAEIFRAGTASIDRGQADAAKSIGMSYGQAMRRIILPQAVRRMVPPFINEFATLMKLTTLGSVLAVNELLHEAENLINNTYRPLEVYTMVAVLFGLMIYPFIWLSQRLEQHWKTRG